MDTTPGEDHILNLMLAAVQKNEPGFTQQNEKAIIRNELLRGKLSTTAKIKDNHAYLTYCQDTINLLPKLLDIKRIDSIIPEFEEIEINKNDSEEIKKFIRKANYEFMGYSCQHKIMDRDWDSLNTYAEAWSPEFLEYRDFINNIVDVVWDIRVHDEIDEKWEDHELLPTRQQIDTIINHIIILNDRVKSIDDARKAIEHNFRMNPTCPKCKAAQRKYNYVLKEIQRMREELLEIEEMKNSPVKDKNKPISIHDFINERFDGIDRFKLSEVKESYKKLYGITKTLSELKQDIEEMGGYKITNCQRTYWVNRL